MNPENNEPRRQRHYTSEREIEADIFAAQREMNELNATAQGMLVRAERIKKLEPNACVEWMLQEADKLHAKAARIQEVRLNRLKNTLAAFKTMPLPGMQDVNDVVLQNK